MTERVRHVGQHRQVDDAELSSHVRGLEQVERHLPLTPGR
jgi:hypothetical protein